MPDAPTLTAEQLGDLKKAAATCLAANKPGGASRTVVIKAWQAKALGLPVPAGVNVSGDIHDDQKGDVSPLVGVTLEALAAAVGVG